MRHSWTSHNTHLEARQHVSHSGIMVQKPLCVCDVLVYIRGSIMVLYFTHQFAGPLLSWGGSQPFKMNKCFLNQETNQMHLFETRRNVQPRDGAVRPSPSRLCVCRVQVLVFTLLPVSTGGRGDQHSVRLPDSGQSRKSSSFYVLSFFPSVS